MSTSPHKFGWRPDMPDARDFMFSTPAPVLAALPARVDLRSQCPPVLDQGQLGSCTANASASAHLFNQMKQAAKRQISPSRLFIYYNTRLIENTVDYDAGATIRDSVKSIAKYGVCSETRLPYNIIRFKRKPNKTCYAEGLKHQAINYQRLLQTLDQLKGCLASGYPFIFGFTVYESFETSAVAASGIVPMPAKSEKTLGGHAVMAVGYDDATRRFLIKNSWGTGWGMSGYFTIPYEYLTNPRLSADYWTIRTVAI